MSYSDSSDVSDIDCSDLEKMKEEMLALKRENKRLKKQLGIAAIDEPVVPIEQFIEEQMFGIKFPNKEFEDLKTFIPRTIISFLKQYIIISIEVYQYYRDSMYTIVITTVNEKKIYLNSLLLDSWRYRWHELHILGYDDYDELVNSLQQARYSRRYKKLI